MLVVDATPRRSSFSLRSCKLWVGTVGSCSVSESAIFSSPSPQERQKFWSSAFLFPQLGQYMASHYTGYRSYRTYRTDSYLMLTVIVYVLLRASESMRIV